MTQNHQKSSKNRQNPKTPYVILGKVYFSRGKSLCAAPETPRKENTPGIEPGTLGSQAGGLTTRPDLHGLGDGTIWTNFDKNIEIREMVK